MKPPTGYELLPPEYVESLQRCLAYRRIMRKHGDQTVVCSIRPDGWDEVKGQFNMEEVKLIWCPQGIMMGRWWLGGKPPKVDANAIWPDIGALLEPVLIEFGLVQSNLGPIVFDRDLNQLGTILIGLDRVNPMWASVVNTLTDVAIVDPVEPDGETIFGSNYLSHLRFSFIPCAFQFYPEGRGDLKTWWGY